MIAERRKEVEKHLDLQSDINGYQSLDRKDDKMKGSLREFITHSDSNDDGSENSADFRHQA